MDDVVSAEQLRFITYVKLAGSTASAPITENAFKAKVVERLLHLNPLDEPGEESSKLRDRERQNIIDALNSFADIAFEPAEGAAELAAWEQERMRRMVYQSALNYLSGLIKQVYAHVLATSTPDRAMLEKEPNNEQVARITEAIRRIADHPVWKADLDATPQLRALRDALSKNQDVGKLLPRLGLKLGYAVGVDELDSSWAE